MAQYAGNPGTGSGGYALNPFAGGDAGAGKTMAYAQGLRNYAGNPFAGSNQSGVVGPMSAHLSQAPPLESALVRAYEAFKTDPQAAQYEQYGADINKLWRLSPTSPVFKPGYQHNPYIMQRADQFREQDRLAAMTPEERQQYEMQQMWANQTFSGGGD